MIERDYIMRMIQMLAQALVRILFLKSQKDFPEAIAEIQRASKRILGIEVDVLRRLTDVQMIDLLSLDAGMGIPKCYAAGMLLKEEADVVTSMQKAGDGHELYCKALSLLTESGIRNKGPFDPAHGKAISAIAEKLQDAPVPVHTLKKLFCYHDLTRDYGRAAVVLLKVVAKEPSFAKEADRFYQRLAALSDAELNEGQFTREEVAAGLKNLGARA